MNESEFLNSMKTNATRKANQFIGKFPLLGFESDSKVIRLDASHIIKKCAKRELENTSKRIEISNHKSFEFILFYSYSSKTDVTYPEEIINHFKILYVFFKLFKSGSIGIPYCHHYVKNLKDDTLSSIGFISDTILNYYDEFPYAISKQETSQFKKMWTRYRNLISSNNNGFHTAIRRYYFSSQRFDKEDKVIDLMIAFEALFLTDNAELSFKLSLRVAKFLEDEFDSINLFDFMKQAYTMRSKIVHGKGPKEVSNADILSSIKIKTLIKDLTEILRLSIRKYINSYSDVPYSDFIKCIDEKIIRGRKMN